MLLHNSQVLENPRLLKKIEKLNEARELSKFYKKEPFNLNLKTIREIEKAQSILNNKISPNQAQLDFEVLSYKKELLEKLRNSKNMAQLLYYISLHEELQLTTQQQRHFDLKISCDKGLNYGIHGCSFCGKKIFSKVACNSFFCEECKKFISSRIKSKAREYLWDCNHFFATFTLPMEIQEKVKSWDEVFSKRFYKNKFGSVISKSIYFTDLVYKSVRETLFEYCKKRDLEIGFILMPHSYGTLELNWFFHLNALISSKAIRINPDKKVKTQRRYFENRKLKTEKISFAGFRRIFGDDYSNFNTKKVNVLFRYNEVREIYKRNLMKNFNTSIKYVTQVKFAERKNKSLGRKSIYIEHKRAINIILDYFRHIPLGFNNLIKEDKGFIYYRSSKIENKRSYFKKQFKEFFKMIMQHIPPSNFRTLRQYGLYSNHNKKRLSYPTKKNKPKKPFRCPDCKTIIRKRDRIGLVHCGDLVWINPELKNSDSILDCKDFEWVKSVEIEENGRVMHACEPPDCLKPSIKLNYLKFDEVEDTEKITKSLGDYDGFGIDKINLEKFAIIKARVKKFEDNPPLTLNRILLNEAKRKHGIK